MVAECYGELQPGLDCGRIVSYRLERTYTSIIVEVSLEVYKRETEEILRRFRAKRLTLSQCVASMTSALANLDPAERTVYREALRTWVTANNEEVANELTG